MAVYLHNNIIKEISMHKYKGFIIYTGKDKCGCLAHMDAQESRIWIETWLCLYRYIFNDTFISAGQESQWTGRLCPREIPAAAVLQQPAEHAAVPSLAGRPLPLLQQLHRTRDRTVRQLRQRGLQR